MVLISPRRKRQHSGGQRKQRCNWRGAQGHSNHGEWNKCPVRRPLQLGLQQHAQQDAEPPNPNHVQHMRGRAGRYVSPGLLHTVRHVSKIRYPSILENIRALKTLTTNLTVASPSEGADILTSGSGLGYIIAGDGKDTVTTGMCKPKSDCHSASLPKNKTGKEFDPSSAICYEQSFTSSVRTWESYQPEPSETLCLYQCRIHVEAQFQGICNSTLSTLRNLPCNKPCFWYDEYKQKQYQYHHQALDVISCAGTTAS